MHWGCMKNTECIGEKKNEAAVSKYMFGEQEDLQIL